MELIPKSFRILYPNLTAEKYKTLKNKNSFKKKIGLICHECYYYLTGFTKCGGNEVIKYNIYHRQDFNGKGNLHDSINIKNIIDKKNVRKKFYKEKIKSFGKII